MRRRIEKWQAGQLGELLKEAVCYAEGLRQKRFMSKRENNGPQKKRVERIV